MGGMHQLESSKPGSGWQNPPPPAELLKAAALINLLSFPYMFLDGFCLFFLNQLVMGRSPFWGVSRKTPKMPVPTPDPISSRRPPLQLTASSS